MVLGVAARDLVALGALIKLLDCVGAGSVEQPEPRFGLADIRDDQRFATRSARRSIASMRVFAASRTTAAAASTVKPPAKMPRARKKCCSSSLSRL